jgi:hypothetical protein
MNSEECHEKQEIIQPILVKKRGRKPKNRDNIVELEKDTDALGKKKDISSLPSPKKHTIISKIENTILHFPIKSESLKQQPTKNIFNVSNSSSNSINEDPMPYDPNVFINMHADFEHTVTHSFAYINNELPKNKNLKLNSINKKINIVPVLNSFIECNDTQTLPERTDICCFWCTEQFENQPIGMPEKKLGDTFFVKGCFCSFNCMASYNFSLNDDKVWERYSLINLMYKKMYNLNQNFKVELAPPREALVKFGGVYDIQRFRELCLEKSIKALSFPIINIQCYLEEINIQMNDNMSSVGPTQVDVKNYLDKVNNDFKLSRNKTISGTRNTLEMCMGLKNV